MAGYVEYSENFNWTKAQLRKIAIERSHLFGELSKQIIRQKLFTSRKQKRENKLRAHEEGIGALDEGSAGKYREGRNQSGPPGAYPARQTGALIASIGYQVLDMGDVIRTEVGSDLIEAYYLEFGTVNMAARPWLTLYEKNHLPRIARTVFGNTKKWSELEGKLYVKFKDFV